VLDAIQFDLGLPRTSGRYDLTQAMAQAHTPGVGIALIEGGAIAETRYAGLTRVGSTSPVTEHTLFQAGSISKSVAAACALRVVADGRLDLDEDVNDRLRSWRVPGNGDWTPRVTPRLLLSHTAGTTVGGFVGYPAGTPVPSTVDVLNGQGNGLPVVVAGLPGLGYSYSGGGFTVLQQLLVDVTGQDFPALAHELVLDPVGMHDSTFAQPPPQERSADAACGHYPGPVVVPGGWHTYPEVAAAGLWSTAVDLARFFLAVRASLLGHDGALLPKELAEQMATPAHPTSSYGLGLALADEPRRIGHGGDTQGFTSWAQVSVDSGQGAVIMTNSFYGAALIRYGFEPILERAFGWASPPAASPAAAPTAPTRYGEFLIEPAGEQLRLVYGQQPPITLSPVDGYWSAVPVNLELRFEPGILVITQDGEQTRVPAS
jgi:CubicO group peptidase (beta-lactamase class C family)